MIVIPLPYGYVNAGDIFVLLAGFCLGPLYGGAAAALGCALADLLCGYAIYAPATSVIKFAVAALSVLLCSTLLRHASLRRVSVLVYSLAALVGDPAA